MSAKFNKPIRKPWAGAECDLNQSGLLIVGESHYWAQDDRDNPDITNIVIESVIDGRRFSFFTKIEAAIRGVESINVVPKEFWPKHAFANFCQGAFPLARKKPRGMEAEMFRRGIEAFPLVLHDLKPKRMLVFSKKTWNKFDKFETMDWYSKAPIRHEGKEIDNGYLTDVDGKFHVYCTWIPHPSAPGWGSPMRWAPLIREFLTRELDPPPAS